MCPSETEFTWEGPIPSLRPWNEEGSNRKPRKCGPWVPTKIEAKEDEGSEGIP